jgi:hypothetical protein
MTSLPLNKWPGYRPLDYSVSPEWGSGARVVDLLLPLELSIWNLAAPFQDLRGDRGHAELVVFTTLQFCRLLGIAGSDREIAVLSAIIHDTGYSRIPDIHERFHRAFDDLRAGRGKDGFWALKTEHEKGSVQYAREWLTDYAHLDQVIGTVACHDTRTSPCPPAGKVMWDADRIWRFSVLAHSTYRAGIGFDDLLAQMQREVLYGDWQTEPGPWAAKMEMLNSLWVMFPERLPDALPDEEQELWPAFAETIRMQE